MNKSGKFNFPTDAGTDKTGALHDAFTNVRSYQLFLRLSQMFNKHEHPVAEVSCLDHRSRRGERGPATTFSTYTNKTGRPQLSQR